MIFDLLKYWISLIYWDKASVEKVRKMQLKKFRAVFEYARAHSEIYRDYYEKMGVSNLAISSWDDVQKVPIMDKGYYRSIPLEKRMTCSVDDSINIHTTSGSSGNPLQIAYTKGIDYSGHVRVFFLLHKVAGYTPFKKILMVSRFREGDNFSVEKDVTLLSFFQRKLKLFRREIVSVYDDPDYIIDRIIASNPDILWSTPSAIEVVCNKMIERSISIHIPYLFLTSENISDYQYDKFKKTICNNVVDLYGAMESPSISYDLNKSGVCPVFSNSCLVEYVNNVRDDGSMASIVITSLLNNVTPFIRYCLNDYGPKLDTPGFPNKLMGPIIGRVDDILTFPDGKPFFHHQAHAMFMDFCEVIQFKFLQVGDGPIHILLVQNPNYSREDIEQKAIERWKARFPKYELVVEFVDSIEIDERTGKCKNIEHRKIS